MKKLILTTIILIFSILLIPFSIHKVDAQDKEPIGCEQLREIVGSAECPLYALEDGGLWCSLTVDELTPEETAQGLKFPYKNRPPDYTIDRSSDYWSEDIEKGMKCLGGREKQENGTQPNQSKSDQTTREGKPGQGTSSVQAINDWIKDNFSDLNFEALEAERLYGRTPQMTEEIIRKAQEEWEAMVENTDASKLESPYRLDILEGQIQIKLPGQNEWSDLKVGDRIPPGSTIFTGMDTTTVLSIRDKGVIQVLPFTEVTISEEGLSEPGKTTTEIDLRTGEVELNVPTGIFTTGGVQVITPLAINGVRGTHFWVSYNKDKKLSTVGVYRGEVEVKAKGSSTSTIVSPDGNKPGVVVLAQKLSVTKLLIAAAVLGVFVFGLFWFFKGRRLARKKRS